MTAAAASASRLSVSVRFFAAARSVQLGQLRLLLRLSARFRPRVAAVGPTQTFHFVQGATVQHMAWIRGLAVWVVLAVAGLWYLGHSLQSRGSSPARMATQLWQYSARRCTNAQVQMPAHTLL